MRLLGLGLLALLGFVLTPSLAHAASYPADLVCYVKNPDGTDACAPNEFVKECTTHPNTHLANVGGTIMCVDNAPINPPPLLDAWYPAQYWAYIGTTCPVPDTFLYVGPIPVPPDSCIGTLTTPQDDSVGWFCEDNANYRAMWGPQGYKCVLRVPSVCPGIPPMHLSKIPGYEAYECLLNNPPPACSSTEILTVTVVGPPAESACIQQWPWTSATAPANCPAGETMVSNGQPPPADRYGCAVQATCPAGQYYQQTSPPGAVPIISACLPPPVPACPAGQDPLADSLVNPVHYECCPTGNTLNIVRAPPPTVYSCVPPALPPIVCPVGQYAVTDPVVPPPYYICSPPLGAPCPVGQNRQMGVCVPNSGHAPTCSTAPAQTPTLIQPTAGYTCQPLTNVIPPPTITCPAGQHAETTVDAGGNFVYACVANPPGLPPPCPPGQYSNMTSPGPPPVYACVVMPAIPACPPGQFAAVTNYAPITYACTNGGN